MLHNKFAKTTIKQNFPKEVNFLNITHVQIEIKRCVEVTPLDDELMGRINRRSLASRLVDSRAKARSHRL